MRRARLATPCIAALLMLLRSGLADAHIIASRLGDFYAGALHPLTDILDVVTWTALGLLAGSLGASRGRWLVLVLPLGLLAGVSAGMWLDVGALATPSSAGMMILLGLIMASAWQIGTLPLCAIAFALAMLRGAANAAGIGADTDRVLFAAGLGAAGYVVITLVMALTVIFRGPQPGTVAPWRSIAVRAIGSWIAAIGLMIGGFALAGR